MLDVAVEKLTFHYRGSTFLLHEVGLLFPKQTHTILAGPSGAGKTTLLKLLAGELRTRTGVIRFGSRDVSQLKPSERPVLYVSGDSGLPSRWSARHVLIAAARQRKNDREDRLREIELAEEKWCLEGVAERRCDQLSHSERCRLQLARIEILRPAVLLAERILERAAPAEVEPLADQFYRSLRVSGTTVISETSRYEEQRWADLMVVLNDGLLIQEGPVRTVHELPASAAAAMATGTVNRVPVEVGRDTVTSPLGTWPVSSPPFLGRAAALIRPEAFALAATGEDSDLIFSVEEAGFDRGQWHLSGFITGGTLLRVTLPGTTSIHKGKLLALTFESRGVKLVRPDAAEAVVKPGAAIPSIRDSR